MGKDITPKPGITNTVNFGGVDVPKEPVFKNLSSVNKEVLEKLPVQLKAHLNEIMAYEKTINEKLKDPKQKKLFLENPYLFFQQNKLTLSVSALNKLKEFSFNDFMKKQSFILPNGKILNPQININLKTK